MTSHACVLQVEEQAQDTSGHCSTCNKHFGTKNAYDNHVKSKKHRDALAKEVNQLKNILQEYLVQGRVHVENVPLSQFGCPRCPFGPRGPKQKGQQEMK